MKIIQYINIVKITFIIAILIFSLFVFFNFWDDFKREDIFFILNGYGIFFFSAPVYFLYIKGFIGNYTLKKDFIQLTKKYLLTFENFIFLFSGVLFIVITSDFDTLLILSIIEHYLFLTCLSLIIFVTIFHTQSSLLLSLFIVLWHFLTFNFLNSFPLKIAIWLNPFSSWSYISWFKNDYLWMVLLPVKWTAIIWIIKSQAKVISPQ